MLLYGDFRHAHGFAEVSHRRLSDIKLLQFVVFLRMRIFALFRVCLYSVFFEVVKVGFKDAFILRLERQSDVIRESYQLSSVDVLDDPLLLAPNCSQGFSQTA